MEIQQGHEPSMPEFVFPVMRRANGPMTWLSIAALATTAAAARILDKNHMFEYLSSQNRYRASVFH